MKAAVIRNPGVIQVEDIPLPDMNEEQILVKVYACGICGTDLRIFRHGDNRAKYPIVIGHEIAGVIEDVGTNVSDFHVGDRVCVAPGHGCGECDYCLKGHYNVCTAPCPSIGFASNGGLAEYMVPPVNVIKNGFVNKIPPNLSFEAAALAEPLACCINGHRNAEVKMGDTVLIYGAGAIGCFHVVLSKLMGAKRVFVVDDVPERLEGVKQFHPDRIIDYGAENTVEVVKSMAPLGVDVVFTCAPSRTAQEEALMLVAPRGRVNLFGGLAKDNSQITIDANKVHYDEIFISGTSSSLPETNREALKLLAEQKIVADDFISHVIPLDELEKGFSLIEKKRGLKVIITP